MTLKDQILDALKDGPGLACELAVELQMNSRKLSPNLADLERRGYIVKQEFWKPDHSSKRKMVWLYSLKEAA